MALVHTASFLHIFRYDTPVVPLQQGVVWRVNGGFKLAHVIDLQQLQQVIANTTEEASLITGRKIGTLVAHYLERAADGISKMTTITRRKPRSIDWLGSAWKWVAGSPDASDWNSILQTQEHVLKNDNQQIRINTRLFDSTRESIQKLNELIQRVNTIDGDAHVATILLHKAMILVNQVDEITRACQLAKSGVVNTNLLDHTEIETLLSETESLPYQNVVEAIEFSEPSVLTNGSSLLYVLSMPKVVDKRYRLMLLYPTIRAGKQVELEFNKLAMDSQETYAILGRCLSIGNTTVCRERDLKRLEEDDCIPRLLKGGRATCNYVRNNQEVVKLVDDGTLFLTNFNDTVTADSGKYQLSATANGSSGQRRQRPTTAAANNNNG